MLVLELVLVLLNHLALDLRVRPADSCLVQKQAAGLFYLPSPAEVN